MADSEDGLYVDVRVDSQFLAEVTDVDIEGAGATFRRRSPRRA